MKTLKEQIQIMQAFAEGQLVQFKVIGDDDSEWADISQPSWSWGTCDYRVKPETLINSWEEYCKLQPEPILEEDLISTSKYRDAYEALEKLIRLRDHYNGSYIPDWTNNLERKYLICRLRNSVVPDESVLMPSVLYFPTIELRDRFLENFKQLIECAKPLL